MEGRKQYTVGGALPESLLFSLFILLVKWLPLITPKPAMHGPTHSMYHLIIEQSCLIKAKRNQAIPLHHYKN
jgi:hypothetical protein